MVANVTDRAQSGAEQRLRPYLSANGRAPIKRVALRHQSSKEREMSGTTSNNANKKRYGKFGASSIPARGKAVNAGPVRGDNSFPASNKAKPNNSQYSPGPAAEANAAIKAAKSKP
jgi:hypothetical protein